MWQCRCIEVLQETAHDTKDHSSMLLCPVGTYSVPLAGTTKWIQLSTEGFHARSREVNISGFGSRYRFLNSILDDLLRKYHIYARNVIFVGIFSTTVVYIDMYG